MDLNPLPAHSRKRTGDDLCHSEAKTRHRELFAIDRNPTLSTSKPALAHAARTYDQCTDAQTINQIASANTVGQLSNPAAYTDNGIASIQITDGAVRSTSSRKVSHAPTSPDLKEAQLQPVDMQKTNDTVSPNRTPKRSVTSTTHTGDGSAASNMQSMRETHRPTPTPTGHNESAIPSAALQNHQTPASDMQAMSKNPTAAPAPVAHVNTQSASDVHRAESASTASASSIWARMTPTVSEIGRVQVDMLPWKSTPFSLARIGDNLFCPRLTVDPQTALSRILPLGSHTLDNAVIAIHRHGGLGMSLPCEAIRVLTVYDNIHRRDFSGTNITLLDPYFFNSLHGRTYQEQNAFHENLGGWIDHLGQRIRVKDKI